MDLATVMGVATSLIVVGVVTIVFTIRSSRPMARKVRSISLNLLWFLLVFWFVNPPDLPGLSREAILLTPGFARSPTVGSAGDQVFSVDPGSDVVPNIGRVVSDLSVLNRHHPEITELVVYGHGLPKEQWLAWNGMSIDFESTDLPLGMVTSTWTKSISLSEALRFHGQSSNATIRTAQLLNPYGEVVDSTEVAGEESFVLTTVPKASGNYIYQLALITQDGVTMVEPVPVSIKLPVQTRIALQSASPNFEFNFLKRWAEASGSAVYQRTQITKDKFRSTWINTDQEFTLAEADVLISDLRSWARLNPSEQGFLLDRVRSGAMGLLIIADELEANLNLGDLTLEPGETVPVTYMPDQTHDRIKLLAGPVHFPETSRGMESFGKLGDHVRFVDVDRGRIGVTRIINSFRLATHGLDFAHGEYWQTLIGRLLENPTVTERFIEPQEKPYSNQRTQLCFESGAQSIGIDTPAQDGLRLALKNLNYRNDIRCAYFWPRESGWHRLVTDNGSYYLYVFHEENYLAEQRFRTTQETHVFAPTRDGLITTSLSTRSAPRLWFFLGLLIVATALWWEQKTWTS